MIDHRTKGINKKQSKKKFDNQLNILNMTLMDMKNTSFLDEDDINDVLLDSCNEEYTGISATLTSKKLEKQKNLASAIIVLYQQEKYYTMLLVSG